MSGSARFVPRVCPASSPAAPNSLKKARCGLLLVPENWANPSGPKIGLPVMIVPSAATRPAPDPIVFFYGGPGGDAVLQAGELVKAGLNRDRDIVLMSQRGAFSSQPSLYCPEIFRFNNETVGRALL
jgi:hypothetical protein